jgi:hypothetical protein
MSSEMKRWKVRAKAVIDDTWEVDAETEEEALEAAFDSWTFVEAHSWETTVVGEIKDRGER